MSAESRIAKLLRRQSELAAALRSAKEKRRAAELREMERLAAIVGRVVLETAAQSPTFKETIVNALRSAVSNEAEKKLLQRRSWL